jgi:hypothetical protein
VPPAFRAPTRGSSRQRGKAKRPVESPGLPSTRQPRPWRNRRPADGRRIAFVTAAAGCLSALAATVAVVHQMRGDQGHASADEMGGSGSPPAPSGFARGHCDAGELFTDSLKVCRGLDSPCSGLAPWDMVRRARQHCDSDGWGAERCAPLARRLACLAQDSLFCIDVADSLALANDACGAVSRCASRNPEPMYSEALTMCAQTGWKSAECERLGRHESCRSYVPQSPGRQSRNGQ